MLVAGIAAFAVSRLGGGGAAPASTPAPHAKQVPLARAARQVAFRFVETAVARRHLDESYRIVTPALRQGMSPAEWRSGTIPVTPYPVAEAAQRWHVLRSLARRASLEVAFVPAQASSARAEVFQLVLRKLGGRWLVDSWQPRSAVAAPAGP